LFAKLRASTTASGGNSSRAGDRQKYTGHQYEERGNEKEDKLLLDAGWYL
jgi:hypothetical protein